MKSDIKNLLNSKTIINKASRIIKNENNTDTSIKTLRRLRFLANPVVINMIGVLLFFTILIAINISVSALITALGGKFKIINIIIPNVKYWVLYLFGLAMFIVIYLKLRVTIVASFETIEYGQKGNSRLTTQEEIKEQYREIQERDVSFEGKGGVPISRYEDKIYIDSSPLHTIVIGTTRSGKGQGFVLVTIDIYSRAKEKSSLVFNDPKGELCGLSKELLESKGYDVRVIDFFEMENSIGYNPLQIIKEAYKEGDFGEAELRCRTFTYSLYHNEKSQDPIWEDLSMNLVNALILALCEKCIKTYKELALMSDEEKEYWCKEEQKVNLFAVANMLTDLGGEELEEGTVIDIYFDNLPKESMAKRQYQTVKFAEGKTRASVFVTAAQKLQVYLSQKVAVLTSNNDIDLEEVGFYKSARKKAKVVIMDALRENIVEENIINNEEEIIEGKVNLVGVKDIICYKNDNITKEFLLREIKAYGVNGEDLSEEIDVNFARVNIGTPGIYNIEYSVQDIKNSKPIALFLIVPDFDSSNHILATTCISQLTYMLSRRSSLSLSGTTDREVVFVLDEAGNMSAIENFSKTLTVCLGRGLKYMPIVQSFAQLKELYGDNYKTIVDNCANTIYIKTTDVETAEEIEKMSGERTIIVNNRVGEVLSFNKAITESLDQVPVIRYDDLIHIKEGENVVIRPMYRKDLKGNRITPYPIYNCEEMGMKFKYEYLNDVFSSNDSMRNIYIENNFHEVILEDLRVDFEAEMSDLVAEKIEDLMKDKARKEIIYAEVKQKLSMKSKQEQKKKVQDELIMLNNKDNIKKSVKQKVISILNKLIDNEKIEYIKDIEDREELLLIIEELQNSGEIDKEDLIILKKVINEQ